MMVGGRLPVISTGKMRTCIVVIVVRRLNQPTENEMTEYDEGYEDGYADAWAQLEAWYGIDDEGWDWYVVGEDE